MSNKLKFRVVLNTENTRAHGAVVVGRRVLYRGPERWIDDAGWQDAAIQDARKWALQNAWGV